MSISSLGCPLYKEALLSDKIVIAFDIIPVAPLEHDPTMALNISDAISVETLFLLIFVFMELLKQAFSKFRDFLSDRNARI